MCNRKRCNEPCTNVLACEHLCIGFCGEECPKLCRICDKEKLTKFFSDIEKKPDARYVKIRKC